MGNEASDTREDRLSRAGENRDVIRFLLGDEPVEVAGIAPTTTLLEWLRLHRRRTGTKEGCAEGDCGACTVIVGRPEAGRLRYETLNACIRFLPMLDGCHILTVEDLALPDGSLHPAQSALVEAHGSQCGYCTPGFVMALWALWRPEAAPDRAAVLDGLAGNLCRCTGYGPIVDAALSLHGNPPADDWRSRQAAAEPALLADLQALDDGCTLDLKADGQRFVAPRDLDALADLLAGHPDARILAGGTDIGLWVTKADRDLPFLVWIGKITALQRIELTQTGLIIGAGVSYARAAQAIATLGADAERLWRRIASPPIRNAGTLGGNIANGSPIGDTPPMLIALGASLVLQKGRTRRHLPIEDFFQTYGRQDRQPGEFLVEIDIPRPPTSAIFKVMKISKRFDQDISALLGAFLIVLDDAGRVRDARIAFGGMAGVPKRAGAVEAALLGQPWTLESVERAAEAMNNDFAPLSDMRASAGYRLLAAANLLRKCYLESAGQLLRLDPDPPARHPTLPALDMSHG